MLIAEVVRRFHYLGTTDPITIEVAEVPVWLVRRSIASEPVAAFRFNGP